MKKLCSFKRASPTPKCLNIVFETTVIDHSRRFGIGINIALVTFRRNSKPEKIFNSVAAKINLSSVFNSNSVRTDYLEFETIGEILIAMQTTRIECFVWL